MSQQPYDNDPWSQATPPEQPQPMAPQQPPTGQPHQPSYQPVQPTPGASRCLVGCLIVLGVVVVLLVAGIFLIVRNWRSMAATGMNRIVEQMVDQSNLPPEQQQGVMEHVIRFTDELRAGEVTVEQFGRVFQEFTDGPLLPTVMVWAVKEQHLSRSGLSPEEKEDAELQTQRYFRGLFEERIRRATLEEVLEPVTHAHPRRQPEMKEQVSDEELRQFIALLKAEADRAEIPTEPYEPDIAAAVGRMIDRALEREPAQPPP